MPPLYPRMRERPPEILVNRDSPLYKSARGIYIPEQNTHILKDNTRGVNAVPVELSNFVVWSHVLKRFVLSFPGSPSRIPLGFTGIGYLLGRPCCLVCWVRTLISPTTRQAVVADWNSSGGGESTRLEFSGHIMPSGTVGGTLASAGGGTPPVYMTGVSQGRWYHVVMQATSASNVELYVDGRFIMNVTQSSGNGGNTATLGRGGDYAGLYFTGELTDLLLLRGVYLSPAECEQIADPSNVDLRVGGVPLILPPRRRFWPVVSEQGMPKMVPWHLFQQVSA